jgi:hypothetical protein
MFEKCNFIQSVLTDKLNPGYGEVIYSSPTTYICPDDKDDYSELKWEVTKLGASYNVLTKIIQNKVIQERLIQSFSWRESAMKFALEMLLICNGKMNRHGLKDD